MNNLGTKQQHLRAFVRGTYDLQKMRMQLGNRICAQWREENGQKSGQTKDQLDKQAQKVMTEILKSYKLLTDGLVKLPTAKKFTSNELITSYTMLCLVDEYVELKSNESKHFRRLEGMLDDFPIWSQFMKGVCGVGPAMAGVIISEIDIHKATYPSSIFKYAGLDVVRNEDGTLEGRSRKKHHLEESEYKDKDGEVQKKMGITFNPFLKTKLVGVLGGSFMKQGVDKSKYAKMYYDYRHRLENMPVHKEKSKGHIHNMSNRYIVKQFIIDLYMKWRELEGLPVYGTYAEEKLGIIHKKQVA